MKCPLCLDTDLDVTFHAGIELDICSKCRGVWLDRGELDRIAGIGEAPPRRPAPADPRTLSDAWDNEPGVRYQASSSPAERRQSGKKKPGKNKSKKRLLADRLGDVFEEILDL